MLESNLLRNSQPELIQTMSGGVGGEAGASIGGKDFPMPKKTHKGNAEHYQPAPIGILGSVVGQFENEDVLIRRFAQP